MAVSTETANDLMVAFSSTVSSGFDALAGAVNGVFGLMIALVVALTGVQWALSANREVLASGFSKILLIGFFAYLINDWRQLSEAIQIGFIKLGLTAGGGALTEADFLNPGAILEQGWRIVKALGDAPAPLNSPLDVAGNLTDALVLGLAMIGVMLAFAVLALQIIVTLLEFKIVTLGGFVLLPFGIWTKSAFLAERPLGFVVSSGLKVLALAIVVSGARSVFDQLQPSGEADLYEALAILAAALLLAMLAISIPNLAAALVTGGPTLGAGATATGGLAIAGGGALAATGLTGAGAAVARIAGPARHAAGAAAGRSAALPLSSPPPTAAPPFGGPPGGGSPGGPPPSPTPAGPPPPGPAPSGAAPTAPGGEPPRNGATKAGADATAEAEAAAAESASPQRRRHAALQAFLLANTGRSLLPASESSGTASPPLKPEEP